MLGTDMDNPENNKLNDILLYSVITLSCLRK
jgi:hypothetical protein